MMNQALHQQPAATQLAAQLLAAADKATLGPWTTHRTSILGEGLLIIGDIASISHRSLQMSAGDAAFIALSREAAPALAKAYLELREVLQAISERSGSELTWIEWEARYPQWKDLSSSSEIARSALQPKAQAALGAPAVGDEGL